MFLKKTMFLKKLNLKQMLSKNKTMKLTKYHSEYVDDKECMYTCYSYMCSKWTVIVMYISRIWSSGSIKSMRYIKFKTILSIMHSYCFFKKLDIWNCIRVHYAIIKYVEIILHHAFSKLNSIVNTLSITYSMLIQSRSNK